MASGSNQRKTETLGMNASTANSLLRRNIIYALLTSTRWEDHSRCYRCGEYIVSSEELSIEHKQPWEGRENGRELYWDLDNIDFSHRRCNKPHIFHGFSKEAITKSGETRRKVGPEGTAYCGEHKNFLPVENFHKNADHWNGLMRNCKECNNTRRKAAPSYNARVA